MNVCKVVEWSRRSSDGLVEYTLLHAVDYPVGSTVDASGHCYRVVCLPDIGVVFVAV